MPKWVIEYHKDICIGCGVCAAIEPRDWEMQGDKSHLKGSAKIERNPKGNFEVKEIDQNIESNQEAADACPVPCIFIKKIQD